MGRRTRTVLLGLSVGLVLADSSVVALALPKSLAEFDVEISTLAWALTSFNLALALSALPAAFLARRWPRLVFGAGSVVFVLHPADGSLVYERAATEFMGVPVPSFLSPRIHASVSPDPAGWHVDVAVHWRRHLICRYWGRMQPLKTT